MVIVSANRELRAATKPRPSKPSKPSITIHIDQHYTSKVYTSGSTISGHVEVKTQTDVPFDDLSIVFGGVSATRLDFVQQYTTRSCRQFLKLRMPIVASHLPEPRVFEAGQTYVVPFTFVVPHQLTIGACSHKVSSPATREQHLRLPPTVGYWEGDDQAPDMAQIQYFVRARVFRGPEEGSDSAKLMEAQQTVKVLPALAEDAPLDITHEDEQYRVVRTKTIRKGRFSGKIGKLTAVASQPGAVMLTADGRDASPTTARVSLEFAPEAPEIAPPKINSVSGKLTTTTYFSGSPTSHQPNLGSRSVYSGAPSLNYSTTSSLFAVPVESVSWKQRNVSLRRDSGYSSAGVEDEASESDASLGRGRRGSKSKGSKGCPIRHTGSLEIPFTIPHVSGKVLLPTFHNCLISRVYTLQLTLCVGPTNTAMSFAVPLQVGVETIHEPQHGGLPSFESAVAQAEEAEVDEFLQSRVLRASFDTPQHNDLLPGYEELSRRTVRVV